MLVRTKAKKEVICISLCLFGVSCLSHCCFCVSVSINTNCWDFTRNHSPLTAEETPIRTHACRDTQKEKKSVRERMRQTETKRQRARYAEIRSRKIKHTSSTWTLSDIITNSFSRNLHWISTYIHTAYTYQFYSWKLIMVRVVKLISISSTLPMNSFHPSIHPSVYFADKYKQINIKVHLQGQWKKRGDSLLSPLTHNILLYF